MSSAAGDAQSGAGAATASRNMVARAGVLALAAIAVLVIAATGLVRDGRAALAASDDAWRQGDALSAVVHARAAARAYVPLAEHMEGAFARLREIGETSERKGDLELALFAWRAVLSSATSSRPFSGAPCGAACAAAEKSVARLSNALAAPVRTPSIAAARRARTGSMDRNEGSDGGTPAEAVVPRASAGALLLVGAALLVGGALWLSQRLKKDGVAKATEVRVAAGMALAALVVWIAGVLFG